MNDYPSIPDIPTAAVLLAKLNQLIHQKKISENSYICFVDDGSRDRTWQKIEDLTGSDDRFRGILLAGNFGHQNALYAGIYHYDDVDCSITLDCDLQDDPEIMSQMIEHYSKGSEVVYGARSSRKSDSFFKRNTGRLFYQLLLFFGVKLIPDHADYRLLSKKAMTLLADYKEQNHFLRGIVPGMGLPSSIVKYERAERIAGETKYPLSKMLSFAIAGITSFSVVPLRLISVLGLTVFLISIVLAIWALYPSIFSREQVVPGWASTVITIYSLGGIQLLAVGILGEYLGKTFVETKARPRYAINKFIK